jgi:divalent metal cation (Fe/Co/Zn/Cd) transporter
MKNDPPIDLKAEHRAINILCNALIIGMSAFLLIIIASVRFLNININNIGSSERVALIAAIMMAAVCLYTANLGYRRQMTIIANAGIGLRQKLEIFRAALIRYMSICEMAGLFGVIGFFLTGNYWFPLITVLMLTAMIIKRPTKLKMISELQLDSQQQLELSN